MALEIALMIVAILALVGSGVSIYMIADLKKKMLPVATNSAAKTGDEEE